MGKEYKVGYGRPPRHTRFKKGQSGNPKGRPKGSKDLMTMIREILDAPVQVTQSGKKRTVRTLEAILLRTCEKALKGEQRAIDKLLDLAREVDGDELADAVRAAIAPSDEKILENYLSRRRREEEKPDGDETSAPSSKKGPSSKEGRGDE